MPGNSHIFIHEHNIVTKETELFWLYDKHKYDKVFSSVFEGTNIIKKAMF